MRTIITKRNHNTLIGFTILLCVFLFFRHYYLNLFIAIEQEVDRIYDIYSIDDEASLKIIHSKTIPLYEMNRNLEWQFGFIIIFFSLISFLILVGKCKTLKNKFFIFFTFVFLNWLIFAITNSHIDCDTLLNVYENDNYYLSLLFLTPFLYFIYKDSIIGVSIDITEEVKTKTDISHKENLNDLDSLLKLELISQEEYNEKKEFRIKEKIRAEIKETEEYNLLSNTKQKGLLTEDEFNTKVENLVSRKYNSEK
ncbi:MAG TPA: hypothetical protein PLP39_09060 [Flavobacterium lutivivi]|nr:hypothetical protein [Flavobacterium lutivivi]